MTLHNVERDLSLTALVVATSLNLSRSLLKSEDIAKVHDQNLLNAMLLKAVFPLPEHFCWNKNLAVVLSTVDTNSTGASPSS